MRPPTYAENHMYRARRHKTTGLLDVWGSNYEFDVLEEARDACDQRCVIITECSNYPHAERGKPEEEAKQIRMIERDLATIANKPYVAGFALWSFNDYATLRKKRYRRFCGLVDAHRNEKQSARFLREKYGSA